MAAETHSFNIGRFACLAVADGLFNYPVGSFFSGVPRDEIEAALRARDLPHSQIATPYTCLYIDTGSHRIMVDTGAGGLGARAAAFFPTVDHATTVTGLLLPNLRSAGIEPADIDIVIITHAHPDHIGGTQDNEGRLAFPAAQYYVWEGEWNFWFSEAAAEQAPASFVEMARRNLDAFRSRVTLVDHESEIVAGVAAIATPGHTPGHIALTVASDGETLLHVSDVVLHPLHLEHPDWLPVFDMDREEAAKSKVRIFDLAARENALVFGHHFPPFPNLGRVTAQESGWRWEPVLRAAVRAGD